MMTAINNLGAGWSDFALLAFAAILFGALGALVAYLASVFWFRRWTQRSAQEDKLADTAHTSLLGFAAFVLALAITNVFSNFARTEEAVRLEALEIRRLDRELEPLGRRDRRAQGARRLCRRRRERRMAAPGASPQQPVAARRAGPR